MVYECKDPEARCPKDAHSDNEGHSERRATVQDRSALIRQHGEQDDKDRRRYTRPEHDVTGAIA